MAILAPDQALLLIQTPANADQLRQAVAFEQRVKLHTQASIDQGAMQSQFDFFREWIARILPPDKMDGFMTLWCAPGETTELAESIFGELYRVFQAENPYTDHKFKDGTDLNADFLEFLDRIEDEKFWTEHYWNELKTDQNSILVVDLPAVQTTSKPEPYVYLLDISNVIDAVVTRDGCFEYLIAWTDLPGQIMVLDDNAWTLCQCEVDKNGAYDLSKITITSIVPNGLKNPRVTAKPLFYMPVGKHKRLINHNPITKSLGRFDWLLFFEVSKKYLETYAPYPIYATYAEQNDAIEETQDKGEEFMTGGREGMLSQNERIVSVSSDNKVRNAQNRKLVGPGTIQRFEAPRDKDEVDLLQNPVQVIPAEEISLNYCQEAAEKYHDQIFSKCVGRGGDVLNTQAANELQVQSTFESRVNILAGIRTRIEEVRKYVYELFGELRYGDKYIGTDVSLGDVYYLTTVKDMQDQVKDAKDAGMPVYELQNQFQSIFRSKYRDQPQMLARNQILAELEPYPGLTIQEVADLVGKGYANKDRLRLKIDFDSLVRRFEREQMSIVDFASAKPLATKIDTITLKLLEYVKADEVSNDSGQSGEGSTVPGSGTPGERSLPPTT